MYKHKNEIYKPGYGYSIRPIGRTLAIIIHSTNGRPNSHYDQEYNYLLHSNQVSAHYLIGKDGQTQQLLDDRFTAWHVGVVNGIQWSNNNTIGIEVHYTLEESKFIPKAIEALTTLVRMYQSKNAALQVEMHRTVAAPKGRKVDPSFFTDQEFYHWRAITLQEIKEYRVLANTQIYTAPDKKSPKADHITNSYATHGVINQTCMLQCKRQDSRWLWITDGVGFIELSRTV